MPFRKNIVHLAKLLFYVFEDDLGKAFYSELYCLKEKKSIKIFRHSFYTNVDVFIKRDKIAFGLLHDFSCKKEFLLSA